MKKISLVAISLFSLLLTLNVQAQEKAPKIEFEVSTHEFGDIYQGDVVNHTFTFENKGTAPLVLTNVATTCGCTAPEWPREPIMPGESGEVLIKFNSTGKMGIQNKVITIFSNASNPQERISITTNVLPKKKTTGNNK